MDKCIKVLIPTGEVRLINDFDVYYIAADTKSAELIDGLTGGPHIVEISESTWGGWICFDWGVDSNTFPVIAQYGDEFPV